MKSLSGSQVQNHVDFCCKKQQFDSNGLFSLSLFIAGLDPESTNIVVPASLLHKQPNSCCDFRSASPVWVRHGARAEPSAEAGKAEDAGEPRKTPWRTKLPNRSWYQLGA